eukprot:3297205-Rhodomonas_salina.3
MSFGHAERGAAIAYGATSSTQSAVLRERMVLGGGSWYCQRRTWISGICPRFPPVEMATDIADAGQTR